MIGSWKYRKGNTKVVVSRGSGGSASFPDHFLSDEKILDNIEPKDDDETSIDNQKQT